ncbi:TPA: hypothetical protein GXZ54_07185 [bacterium]|nr:hypothetical protein [bacterium]
MKEILFYQINDRFRNVFVKDSLKVFLELYKRINESDNVKRQFELFIEEVSFEGLQTLIERRYSDRDGFIKVDDYTYKIRNIITGDEEIITINLTYIKLQFSGKSSLFLDLISLYFPSMVAINLEANEIISLENITGLNLI